MVYVLFIGIHVFYECKYIVRDYVRVLCLTNPTKA